MKVRLPALYPAQHEAIYHPARYVVIEASTKAGKTLGCLVWQMGRVIEDGGVHWWVAPVYAQARMAYERALGMLPRPLVVSKSRSTLEIGLVNGARWAFRSGEQPDNLFGEDVRSAVIDEASRCRDEAWFAVRSTLTATRGPIRAIGNVRGRSNWHYRLARAAEAGEPDHHFARLTAWDAVAGGVVDRAEIEDAKRVLPDHVFRELYLAEPSDDGGNPFGLDAVAACVGPVSSAEPVCWGADLARSHDWTVAIGLDRAGRVCRFERWRDTWGRTVERLLDLTGRKPGFVDATGVGDPVAEMLVNRGSALVPFVFTSQSKQSIMEGLAAGIQRGKVGLIDGVLRNELEIYEYQPARLGVRYSAPAGAHDDAVCALALAWRWYTKQGLDVRKPLDNNGTARLRMPAKRSVIV